ncbi:MAG: redoxin domain-containing protein [Acidobacteria bacterium]|nr:redoxin domain-containing protein [Acidobacteriota bacterium]
MPVEPGKVNAPEFPADLEWLNVSRPLRMKDLRGKIVLLDFWTYCCINCLHVLPDLERLEKKYPDALVVIGVHSAKFHAERQVANIRQAVLRYGVEHPVVNDAEHQIWSEYAVRAWPSFMLIDPRGKIIGTHSGEQVFELFDRVIGQMVEHFSGDGTLDRRPLEELLPERRREPEPLLRFPGKVLADEAGRRLFIADTGHHRILVAGLDSGRLLDVVGAGTPGLADGDFREARFRSPQGMAVEGDLLYVADTDNHALRRVDLRARTVLTLAGDGEQDLDFNNLPGPARGRRLNSPWDLTIAHGVLFIAMAGPHQIWGYDLEEGYLAGHAGSGREDHVDGPLLAASLAQPSGLSHDGTHLFVADSEVSSIRAVDLDPRGGHVKTVLGQGLFDFGDVDGGPAEARLQHPLDVEYAEGTLFVADTYNNKIKAVGLHTRSARTFAGSGVAGFADGPAEQAAFHEPGGLSHADGKLYVADTNNHRIRVVDVVSGAVSTFPLLETEKLAPRRVAQAVELPALHVAPEGPRLRFELALPAGCKLSPQAASELSLRWNGELRVLPLESAALETELPPAESAAKLRIEAAVYYCEEADNGLCYYWGADYEVALVADAESGSTAFLRLEPNPAPSA